MKVGKGVTAPNPLLEPRIMSALETALRDKGFRMADDRKNADFVMSFTNELDYKNFRLFSLFEWRSGQEIVNLTKLLYDLGGNSPDQTAPDGGNGSQEPSTPLPGAPGGGQSTPAAPCSPKVSSATRSNSLHARQSETLSNWRRISFRTAM